MKDLLRRMYRLQIHRDKYKSLYEKEKEAVGNAKFKIGLKDKVSGTLDELQKQINERNIKALEELLTAFVQDVLPEHGRSIRVEVGISRGVPSLRFLAEDDEGNQESIIDGNGGSLTNIVCAGLRMIALVKSQARPFMVLDEGDCWLSPDRVDAFYRVLFRVTKELGIQLVVITHHDFSQLRHLGAFDVRLVARGDGVHAIFDDIVNDTAFFKGVRLQNFRSHPATYIPFHPGVTVIHGDNSIGKSAVVDALRAVCYGSAEDDCIRHGASECEVHIDTQEGVVGWTRQRKGSPKEIFSIFGLDGEILHQAPGLRSGVPDAITKFLGIEKKDGLDIHLTHQKEPVFLLNLPASQQASILSVGAEAGYVPKMIDAYKDMCKSDRDIIKKGEIELARIENMILEPLAWTENAEKIEENLEKLQTEVESGQKNIVEISTDIGSFIKIESFLSQSTEIKLPERIELHDEKYADHFLEELSEVTRLKSLVPIVDISQPTLPWPTGEAEAFEIVAELCLEERILGNQQIVTPLVPSLHDDIHADNLLHDLGTVQPLVPIPTIITPDQPALPWPTGEAEALEKEFVAHQFILMAKVPALPSQPLLIDSTEAIQLGCQWRDVLVMLHQTKPLTAPQTPTLNAQDADVALQELLSVIETETNNQKQLQALEHEKNTVEKQYQLLLEKTGGECPVCHSVLKTNC